MATEPIQYYVQLYDLLLKRSQNLREFENAIFMLASEQILEIFKGSFVIIFNFHGSLSPAISPLMTSSLVNVSFTLGHRTSIS